MSLWQSIQFSFSGMLTVMLVLVFISLLTAAMSKASCFWEEKKQSGSGNNKEEKEQCSEKAVSREVAEEEILAAVMAAVASHRKLRNKEAVVTRISQISNSQWVSIGLPLTMTEWKEIGQWKYTG